MKKETIAPVWERKLQRGERIMFKKNVWIVGLIAALAIMFVGCVDPVAEETGGGVVEVFNLQSIIADIEDGPISSDADWTKIFGGTPFMMCGGPANGSYSIITEKDVKKVKVDKMGPNWGVGFDLYNIEEKGCTGGAAFRGGDEIFIKGKAEAAGLILNLNVKGEVRLGDVDFTGAFETTQKLTIANVGTIRGGDPQAIRIHYKNGNGSDRKGYIIIEELIIKGSRSGELDVFSDDFEYSNITQQKNWVTAVKITPKKNKSEGKITISYEGDGSTSYAKSTTVPQNAGVYKVTFNVEGVKDKFKEGKDIDGGKLTVFNVLPTATKEDYSYTAAWTGFTGTLGTSANTAITAIPASHLVTGPDSSKFVFIFNNGGAIGNPIINALPSAINGLTATDNGNNYLRLVYKFKDTNWAAYKEVKFTYDLIDTNLNGGGNTNFNIRTNKGGTSYDFDWTAGKNTSVALDVGTGKTWTYPIAGNFGTGYDGLSFNKDGNAGVLLKFTKVELIPY